MEHIVKILLRNINVGKNFPVGTPADGCTGFLPVGLSLDKLLSFFPAYLTFFEMQLIFEPVTPNCDIHVLRGILGSTGAKAVKAQ